MDSLDKINYRYGNSTLRLAAEGKEKKWTTSPDVDHSSLCDGWDVEDFERDNEEN